jgi:hypothetical protein
MMDKEKAFLEKIRRVGSLKDLHHDLHQIFILIFISIQRLFLPILWRQPGDKHRYQKEPAVLSSCDRKEN